jgi:hypothetical protein
MKSTVSANISNPVTRQICLVRKGFMPKRNLSVMPLHPDWQRPDEDWRKVHWEFYLARGVPPVRGIVVVDSDASDKEISQIVEDAAAEIIPSRVTWKRGRRLRDE